MHNLSPWPYLLGVLGAVTAVLFAWYASVRTHQREANVLPQDPQHDAPHPSTNNEPTNSAKGERLIWIE